MRLIKALPDRPPPITMYWAAYQAKRNHQQGYLALTPRRPLDIPQQRYTPETAAQVFYSFLGQPLCSQVIVLWIDAQKTIRGGHILGLSLGQPMTLGSQVMCLSRTARREGIPMTELVIVRNQIRGGPQVTVEESILILELWKQATRWRLALRDWVVVKGLTRWVSAAEKSLIPPLPPSHRVRQGLAALMICGMLWVADDEPRLAPMGETYTAAGGLVAMQDWREDGDGIVPPF